MTILISSILIKREWSIFLYYHLSNHTQFFMWSILFLKFLSYLGGKNIINLFKLSGNKSTIKLSLENQIHLDDDKNDMLTLVEFYSDKFISNVNQNTENAFRFSIGKRGYTLPISGNQYLIKDLKNWLLECLKVYLYKMTE